MSVVSFHFVINLARFWKKQRFLFLCCCVRLVILFYSYFFVCWLEFSPNTRFSNRSDFLLRIKLSLFPCVIWSFLVVRIVSFTCLNCCFTSFYSLKLYINDPQINTMHQALRQILPPIVLSKKKSRILSKLPNKHLLTPPRASINEGSTALETNLSLGLHFHLEDLLMKIGRLVLSRNRLQTL